MEEIKNLKKFKCRNCGEEISFDTTKIPTNVSFDRKCKKCGTFNKIAIIERPEKKPFDPRGNRIKYFNENVFTIENKEDPFLEIEVRKIGEQIINKFLLKSVHYILVVLSNRNTYEKVDKFFEDNQIVLTEDIIKEFINKVSVCEKILEEKRAGGRKF